jgi:hypothetical protein
MPVWLLLRDPQGKARWLSYWGLGASVAKRVLIDGKGCLSLSSTATAADDTATSAAASAPSVLVPGVAYNATFLFGVPPLVASETDTSQVALPRCQRDRPGQAALADALTLLGGVERVTAARASTLKVRVYTNLSRGLERMSRKEAAWTFWFFAALVALLLAWLVRCASPKLPLLAFVLVYFIAVAVFFALFVSGESAFPGPAREAFFACYYALTLAMLLPATLWFFKGLAVVSRSHPNSFLRRGGSVAVAARSMWLGATRGAGISAQGEGNGAGGAPPALGPGPRANVRNSGRGRNLMQQQQQQRQGQRQRQNQQQQQQQMDDDDANQPNAGGGVGGGDLNGIPVGTEYRRLALRSPTQDASLATRLFCPICMLYFDRLYRTSCCRQHVCDDCADAYCTSKGCPGPGLLPLAVPMPPSCPCPHCRTNGFSFDPVFETDAYRRYDDSPGVRKIPAFSPMVAMSPLKVQRSSTS